MQLLIAFYKSDLLDMVGYLVGTCYKWRMRAHSSQTPEFTLNSPLGAVSHEVICGSKTITWDIRG